MVKTKRAVLFALLSLLTVAFIFSNSLQCRDASDERSESIAEKIRPLVGEQEKTLPRSLDHYVRKAAHLIEFAALGLCLLGLTDSLGLRRRMAMLAALAVVLLVAAADETIQIFADGRGPGVADVALDFVGGIIGSGVMAMLLWAARRKVRK